MIYDLIDGEERARQHPTTFKIPSADERRGVRPGDWCKLGFHADAGVERMWVKVTSAGDANAYAGSLDNKPTIVPLKLGDEVAFEPRNILDILRREDKP